MLGQTFSLYNVAGLIDKTRNIYYVPHPKQLWEDTQSDYVMYCYFELFNRVCPPATDYTDIQISNWSPEDRTLRVNGTIDNFRVSRGQGLALNYCIVTRTVPLGSTGRTYFYAFFIDSVRQAGANSVELVMSPDYFTNFFYLNNEKADFGADYDPFNEVMRNCFVERQHYDRFRKVTVGGEDKLELINEKTILGTNESFRYRYQYKDNRYLLPLGYDFSIDSYTTIYNSLKNCFTQEEFNTLITSLSANDRKIVANIFLSYLNIDFTENYLIPLTYGEGSSQEGTFVTNAKGYKAGFTDSNKSGINSPIVHFILPFINIPYDLENINPSWLTIRKKLLLGDYTHIFNTNANISNVLEYLNEINATQYILTSFISKYSPLSKYMDISIANNTMRIGFNMRVDNENAQNMNNTTSGMKSNVFKPLDSFNIPIPALLPIYKESTEHTGKKLIVTDNLFTANLKNGVYVPDTMFTKISGTDDWVTTHVDLITNIPNTVNYEKVSEFYIDDYIEYIGFVIPNTLYSEFTITFSNNVDYDSMIDEGFYYEPILESDPYKFYSISYNEMEQVIHKLRYIDTYTISLQPVISYNDAYKVGIIPIYTVNGKVNRYYGESIVTVISSQIPMINDSWLSYYTQNKAQMKTQYAVNDYQRGSDLAQRVFNTAPAEIGSAFISGGTPKGYGQIIKEVSGMVDDAIDWVQSNKVIRMQQNSKLADIGARPDTIKLSGSDLLYDLSQNDLGFHINTYIIDEVSYNSIAKYLERNGYEVSIQDSLNPFNRVGLNYIKLGSFDFVEDDIKISSEQSESIYSIFKRGVTLLHDKDYLHNLGEEGYHNIELSLLEGGDN